MNHEQLRHLTGITLGITMVIGGLAGCQSSDNFNTGDNFPPSPILQVANSPNSDPAFLASLEQAIYQQVNQYRLSRNLPPLKLNSRISQQAKIHTQRMADGTVAFSHSGFEQRASAIRTTIPYQTAAENVAFNQGAADPATVAVQGWLQSPDHLKNIEGQFDLTGIGVAVNEKGEYYFTQIFIKQSTPAISTQSNSPVYDTAVLMALEQNAYQQVNKYRLSRNLPPLQLDARISYEARLHSQKMAKKITPFSHQGFEKRVKAIGEMIAYQAAAENVAFNQGYTDPVTVAVQGWIKSPDHLKNMEGNFNLTGVGIAKNASGEYYFTQIFILK
ncbi:MAG: CAP domain-containing protein, partial [Microcystaceae cyanobacterium]